MMNSEDCPEKERGAETTDTEYCNELDDDLDEVHLTGMETAGRAVAQLNVRPASRKGKVSVFGSEGEHRSLPWLN